MGTHLEEWDSIDFALGLHDYDITCYQPHFPGYPVYMFFCRLVHHFTGNDVLALTIPGAVFGSMSIAPLFYLSQRMFSEEAAWITVFLFIVNPLCWLQSEKALSDSLGLFFLLVSVHLLFSASTSRVYSLSYLISGSFMLGIDMGVRLSYFPFVILWLYTLLVPGKSNEWDKTIFYSGISAFFAGICVWLIPLVCFTGLNSLIADGLSFTSGHFGEWGGSVVTSQNVFARFSDFLWCAFCNGLGFWCYDTSLFRMLPSFLMGIGILLYVKFVRNDENTRFAAVYAAPYLLWIFLGQNLEKPRHVLPLIPMILICISAGLVRLKYFLNNYSEFTISRHRFLSLSFYHLFIGTLLVSMSIVSIKLVSDHKGTLPAQAQLLDYVERNYDEKSTRIYCGETKRFFEYYAPLWDTRMARNIDDLQYDLGSSLVEPETVLSTSKVKGINSITHEVKRVAKFSNNRYINNPYHNLAIYDLSGLK